MGRWAFGRDTARPVKRARARLRYHHPRTIPSARDFLPKVGPGGPVGSRWQPGMNNGTIFDARAYRRVIQLIDIDSHHASPGRRAKVVGDHFLGQGCRRQPRVVPFDPKEKFVGAADFYGIVASIDALNGPKCPKKKSRMSACHTATFLAIPHAGPLLWPLRHGL